MRKVQAERCAGGARFYLRRGAYLAQKPFYNIRKIRKL